LRREKEGANKKREREESYLPHRIGMLYPIEVRRKAGHWNNNPHSPSVAEKRRIQTEPEERRGVW